MSLRSRHALVRLDRRPGGPEREEEPVRCRLAASLFRAPREFTHPVAVGDEVLIEEYRSADPLVIQIQPRRSQLVRMRLRARRQQVIVANLDLVAIVVSVAEPPLHVRLIDRVLVAAEREHLEVVIFINKCDLIPGLDEERHEDVQDAIQLYEALGYRVCLVSAESGEGLEEARELLAGRTTVFCGHSGVGKSSLLNAIQPGLSLEVGAVSDYWGRGKHTTTATHLLPLEHQEGGYVVDTPGVRAFAIGGMEPWEIATCFRELEVIGRECHFHPCAHDHEPDCAVKKALAAGEIPIGRYESYLRIVHDQDVYLDDEEIEGAGSEAGEGTVAEDAAAGVEPDGDGSEDAGAPDGEPDR